MGRFAWIWVPCWLSIAALGCFEDEAASEGGVRGGCACHFFTEDNDEVFHSVRIACGDVRCVDDRALRCESTGMASWVGECDGVPTGELADERFDLYEDDDDSEGSICVGNARNCSGRRSSSSCYSLPGCEWYGDDYGCAGAGPSCAGQPPGTCERYGCTRVWAPDDVACVPRTSMVSGLGTVWAGEITNEMPDDHSSECGRGLGREAATVWWQPPGPGRYALDVWEADVDAVLTVYQDCGAILGCVDDGAFELDSDGSAVMLVIEGYDYEENGPLHLDASVVE